MATLMSTAITDIHVKSYHKQFAHNKIIGTWKNKQKKNITVPRMDIKLDIMCINPTLYNK